MILGDTQANKAGRTLISCIIHIPPWNKAAQWWLEAEDYQLEAAVLLKLLVVGYVNFNRDTPKSTVSVFICVLLPAEAAVRRSDLGKWMWSRNCRVWSPYFILFVHQHWNMCAERMPGTYKALCCGKALQLDFELKILKSAAQNRGVPDF